VRTHAVLPVRRRTLDARLGLCALLLGAAACDRGPAAAVEGTGTLEFVEVDVAATVGGRVTEVRVEEGDRVRAGDTLAVLSIPTLAAERRQRVARVAAVRAALDEARHGPRPEEITRAEADLAAQSAEAARTADDVTRLTPLAERDMTSVQQLQAAQAAAKVAAARRDAAAAQLRLLREGTRSERLAALAADLAAAEGALAATEATARDLVLLAPVAGRVIARRAEPGEVLAAGERAIVVAETGRQWVRIYVGQDRFPLLRAGQAATATLDALPETPFTGTVRSIATRAEYSPRVALTEQERADLLFAVRVEFRDTTETLKAGLPVTVRITADRP
jgi:HlyD family secretion protein